MKRSMMLGVLVIAATTSMAFAAVAGATTVTAPSGTAYTSTVSATNEGALTLHGVVDVTCNKSSYGSKVESHGSAVTASGKVSTLTFTECNQHVIIHKGGTTTIHPSGGVTSHGAEVTVIFTTIFGTVECTFGTNNTNIGTLTNAPSNSGHAVLDIDSAPIPVVSGSGLCGSSAEWTGKYKVTTPTGMSID